MMALLSAAAISTIPSARSAPRRRATTKSSSLVGGIARGSSDAPGIPAMTWEVMRTWYSSSAARARSRATIAWSRAAIGLPELFSATASQCSKRISPNASPTSRAELAPSSASRRASSCRPCAIMRWTWASTARSAMSGRPAARASSTAWSMRSLAGAPRRGWRDHSRKTTRVVSARATRLHICSRHDCSALRPQDGEEFFNLHRAEFPTESDPERLQVDGESEGMSG